MARGGIVILLVLIFLFPSYLLCANERALMLFVDGLLSEILLEDYEMSKEYYTKAFLADTTDINLLSALLKLLEKEENYPEIYAIGHLVFNLLPDIETKKLVANATLLMMQFEEAEKFYEEIYKKAPNDLESGFWLAYLKGHFNKTKEQEKILKSLVKIAPDSFRTNYELGRFYFDKKRYKPAIKYLKIALEKAPVFSKEIRLTVSLLGQAYKAIGDNEKAMQTLLKLISPFGEPCPPESTFITLLEMFNEKGEYYVEDYLPVIRHYFNCYKMRTELIYSIANAYMTMLDYHSALDYLLDELDKGISDDLLFYYLSRAYLGLKDTVNAKWYAKLAIESFRNSPYGYIALSEYYQKTGQDDLVLKVLDDGLFYASRFEETLINEKLWFFITKKMYTECVKLGLEALKKYPKNTDIMEKVGLAYFYLHDTTSCIYYYEKIFRLEPDRAINKNNLGYYLAVYEKDLKRALKLTKEAVERVPTNSNYLDSYGWALFKLGRVDEAEVQITKALMLNQESGIIWEHMGDIYFHKGMREEARAAWKKALELGDVEDEENLMRKLNSLE